MTERLIEVGNIRVFNFFKHFTLLMLFFPSVTFGIFGDNVEIFPWGILFGLIYINRILIHYIILFFLFLPWFLFAINIDISNFEIYRSLASYFNAILAFFIILEFNEKEINHLYLILKISFVVYIVLGFFQFYFDIHLLETITTILTPRASVSPDNFGITQRGVSALASEQSRSCLEIIFLFTVLILFEKKIRKNINLCFMILIFYLFFINKSLSSLPYIIILYISFYMTIKKFDTLFILLGFISILMISYLTLIILNNLPSEIYNMNRVLAVLHDLSSKSFNDVIIKVYEHSGLRGSSQLAIYLEPTIFGNGLGEAKQAVRDGIAKNEFLKCCLNNWYTHHPDEITRHRPSSFLAVTVAELGFLGAFILFFYIFQTIHSKVKFIFFRKETLLTITLWFSIFFLGSTGSPIPFVCLGLMLKYISMQSNEKLI